MAQLNLNTGTVANDGTGDTLRDAMIKIQSNFTDLYEDTEHLNQIFIGSYFYHASDFLTDSIGDWRQYATADSFITEQCTVGSETKGGGTWVMKHTIQS